MTRIAALLVLITVVPSRSAPGGRLTQASPRACADSATATTADSLAVRFDRHQFVFIGSTHGDLKIEQFLMCLVTRPAFIARATDVVVEWGSSAHQRLMDRYVLALDSIPDDSLAAIWLDTDAPTLWTTLPQVRQFMHTLRAVNRTLPAPKRVRLVGGSEGVVWANVRVAEDLAPFPFKTNLVSHLLVEHLAKERGNRTLVVYGDCHIHVGASNFMGDVEAALGRQRLFITGRIGELRAEDRAFLTASGDPSRAFFVPANRFPRNVEVPPSLRVCGEKAAQPLAEYIDGFVYLGPSPDRSLVGAIPLTSAQQRELSRRSSITADPQRTMRARFGGRAQWFRTHPNDVPPRLTPQ